MKAQIPPLVKCRVVAPDGIQPGNGGANIAGSVPIPGCDLVFLGIDVFLAAGNRRRLAQLESAIHAPYARERAGEYGADLERRPAAALQERRIDVGRVDEEVWPQIFAARRLAELR